MVGLDKLQHTYTRCDFNYFGAFVGRLMLCASAPLHEQRGPWSLSKGP